MSIAEALLAEFEIQAPITRRFLERLPQDKLAWKPHEKSMSAGQLAYHLASVPGNIVRFVQNNPAQAPGFGNFPQPASRDEILKAFEESIATVRAQLPTIDDASMNETWRLVNVRMVLGYWEMVASIANRGLIDEDFFFENTGEHWGVFEQVKPVLAAWRAAFSSPNFLSNLEKNSARLEAWREKRSPGSNETIRKMMEQFRQAAQASKAQAASATD